MIASYKPRVTGDNNAELFIECLPDRGVVCAARKQPRVRAARAPSTRAAVVRSVEGVVDGARAVGQRGDERSKVLANTDVMKHLLEARGRLFWSERDAKVRFGWGHEAFHAHVRELVPRRRQAGYHPQVYKVADAEARAADQRGEGVQRPGFEEPAEASDEPSARSVLWVLLDLDHLVARGGHGALGGGDPLLGARARLIVADGEMEEAGHAEGLDLVRRGRASLDVAAE